MTVFFSQLINGLSLGSIYALIALGYSMVYGIIRLLNFAPVSYTHLDVYKRQVHESNGFLCGRHRDQVFRDG